MKFIDVAQAISEMDQKQLLDANKLIVARLKQLNTIKLHTFSVGENVWFRTKSGQRYEGPIVSMGTKNAKVKTQTPDGFPMIWTVSPGLLNRITAK